MAKLNFNLDRKGEDRFLIMAIVYNPAIKDRYKKSTGHFLQDKVKQWDPARHRVRNHKDAAIINRSLIDLERKFNDYMDDLKLSGRPFALSELETLFEDSTRQRYDPTRRFVNALEEYVKLNRLKLSVGSYKHYTNFKEHMIAYETHRQQNLKMKRHEVMLTDINHEFYTDFSEWLMVKHDNENATINRKIRRIQTVCRFAKKKGWIRTEDYEHTEPLRELKTWREPLTPEEVQAFLKYHTTDMERRMIADSFITGLLTGLRYSDIQQLSDVHFFEHEGLDFINLNMVKVPVDPLSVPVPPYLMNILKRYRGQGRLFTLHENSYSNRILKQIAHELKFRRMIEVKTAQGNEIRNETLMLCQLLSYHVARYTYTRLLDKGGLQTTYIKDNLGHAKITTTEGYLISDSIDRMRETIEVLNKIAS